MRIGAFLLAGGAPLDDHAEEARHIARAGLGSVFYGQFTGWDAVDTAVLAARDNPSLEAGTAIVPTYAQHPAALARQALTAAALTGGRFTLGVGPSHAALVEGELGLSYERPARHVRAYLEALRPLLRGEDGTYSGATTRIDAPGATPPPVILSALGPVMLRIAGELADGVVTTWTGPAALADHIVPSVTAAAQAAGRPAPRVLAGVYAALTDDPESVRAELATQLGFASGLPAYRAILARQGLTGVHETAIAGDERALTAEIARFANAGVTDLLISPHGTPDQRRRTLEFAGALSTAPP
ncbi:TIGR03564 family F420-dependent LLM class oxidoreductase [Actinomadura flavalba]|uniref:TIGR03564 family F420-dependent LLM class oxidoreductase n=1 Tax=Actinomadura flavalba TaxID=1120938 RepID=UPI00039E7BBC|nr:TIGR03564 family F420-dependent LLM class oxidoreductase [Actinomadura flavalba]